ncbi:MAG: membrane protein [Myxococcota bacterium]
MNRVELIEKVIAATPKTFSGGVKIISATLLIAGVVGMILGFFVSGDPKAGWSALLVSAVMLIGISSAGGVISAIFEMTGAKWGRAYRRMAEGFLALAPLGLSAAVVLLVGGGDYLPWARAEHLSGGKHIWLIRGFWDARIIGLLIVYYAVSAYFLYFSLRRDFCATGVLESFCGKLARFVSIGIEEPKKELERCKRNLSILAPIVAILYAFTMTLIAFDLIMALEPEWFSTLFGAWYFIGSLFAAIALLAIISLAMKSMLPLSPFLTELRQRDLATLLFAFTLVNTDFFWSQYLTIWYGNLPEETAYLIKRTVDEGLPWKSLSWVSLFAFFAIPFVFLLFRKVKHSRILLTAVSLTVFAGIFLARFIEIAPAIVEMPSNGGGSSALLPLASSILIFCGFLGAGILLYGFFIMNFPIMPVGDETFTTEFAKEKGAG